jgi:hypothetical protein
MFITAVLIKIRRQINKTCTGTVQYFLHTLMHPACALIACCLWGHFQISLLLKISSSISTVQYQYNTNISEKIITLKEKESFSRMAIIFTIS